MPFNYYNFLFFNFFRFMAQRKAYNLKIVISIYNMFQVAASVYIVVEVSAYSFFCKYFFKNQNHNYITIFQLSKIGFTFRNTWKCVQIETVKDHNLIQRAKLGWFICVLKATDMLDTIFFILRKSERQITFLHVFHHVTTFLLMWLYVKFSIGK